jgi:hypothetical protein
MSRVLAAALAVVVLLQAFIAGGLVVACTTASGHVEFEWAMAVCCDGGDHDAGEDASDSAHDASCSCRDELIAAPDARVTSSSVDSVVPLEPAPTFVELTAPLPLGHGDVRPDSCGPPRSSRPLLVLRC